MNTAEDNYYELTEYLKEFRQMLAESGTGEISDAKAAEMTRIALQAHGKASELLTLLESEAFQDLLP